MNAAKIELLHGLLQQRERDETQRDGFKDYVESEAHIDITGEVVNPTYRAGRRDSYSLRFSLDREETALVFLTLEAIFEQRVKNKTAELVEAGLVEDADAA